MQRNSDTIVGVDLLRILAALLVMGFHLTFWGWYAPSEPTGLALQGAASFPTLGRFFKSGWVGVEIFFVISGFVIALTAENKSARQFLVSRASRLLPAVWVCATVTLIIQALNHSHSYAELLIYYVRALVLFPTGPWIDVVYWTLPIEVMFYTMVFALLCLHGLHHIRSLAIAIAAASFACSLVTSADVFFLSRGCCFSLGVGFWLLSRKATLPDALLCVLFLIGALFQISRDELYALQRVMPLLLFSAAMLAMLLSLLLQPWIREHMAPRFLRMIRKAGLATYPLYLVHNVVGATLLRWLVSAGVGDTASLCISVAACISAAFAVAMLVEPFLRAQCFTGLDSGRGVLLEPAPNRLKFK